MFENCHIIKDQNPEYYEETALCTLNVYDQQKDYCNKIQNNIFRDQGVRNIAL